MRDIKKAYIVISKKIAIKSNGDLEVVTTDDEVGTCDRSEISDFPIGDLHQFFNYYSSYKFKVINIDEQTKRLQLSYKQCHPKLVRDKKRIVSTANHCKTLRKTVSLDIKNFDDKGIV